MKTAVYSIGLLVILNACNAFIPFTRTKEDGVRIKNPDRLKFSGKPFHLSDVAQIDTNAVYVFSNYELPNAKPFEISNASYCRFFTDGRVLFGSCDSIPSPEMINSSQRGWQGYYKIEGDRLMIREFKIVNGGQIILRWGRLDNGDILFYSNTPRAYAHSWETMEKRDLKERWRKVKIEGIAPIQLDW